MTSGVAPQGLAGEQATGWSRLIRMVAADGSVAHRHALALGTAHAGLRDLGDVVHALCAIHGKMPDMTDEAMIRAVQPGAQAWLERAATAFAVERSFLAQLVAAGGPLPSTPGQAGSEAALVAQRHALAMLARSDRTGCATGAVVALVLDWQAIRVVLDRAADRFGVVPPLPTLAAVARDTATVAALAEGSAARAMAFGAEQLLAQTRGLWHLLEARAAARG